MFDVNDDAKGEFRRVEVLTGPGRRRRWSADEKAQIVQESLVAGARVSDVARRWHVCPQQVFGWRREARAAVTAGLGNMTHDPGAGFVPIVSQAASPATLSRAAPVIEVKLAGAVVRIALAADDSAQLTAVLRAVRASASRT